MKHICELRNILGQYFKWNKSRLTVLTNLLLGLFMIKTVNLSELATVLQSSAKTDWKFGKRDINSLTLGVDFKGISLPLAWISLGRAGNSKTADRLTILKKVMGKILTYSFTADRECIGSKWFRFFIHSKIPSFIRIKEDTQVLSRSGSYTVGLKDLCKRVRCGKKKVFKGSLYPLGSERPASCFLKL